MNEKPIAKVARPEFKGLTGEIVKIAQERQDYWKQRLFFQVLEREIESYESLRQAYAEGVAIGRPEVVELEDCWPWVSARTQDFRALLQTSEKVVNEVLAGEFRSPGESGDAAAIIKGARHFGLVYTGFLEFSLSFRIAQHDAILDGVFREGAKLGEWGVSKIEHWVRDGNEMINKIISGVYETDTKRVACILNFDGLNIEPLQRETIRVLNYLNDQS